MSEQLLPKEWPVCLGCGERKLPTELVDGFCRSRRYSHAIPKLTCVRTAANHEPLRYQQTLASVLALRDSVHSKWLMEQQAKKDRAGRDKEVA